MRREDLRSFRGGRLPSGSASAEGAAPGVTVGLASALASRSPATASDCEEATLEWRWRPRSLARVRRSISSSE